MENNPVRVLVVDDEKGITDSIQTQLELEGYVVDTCNSARDALRRFTENPYPIVLTDINMPEMDGLELLEKINEIRPDCFVIMITAYTSITKVLNARYHGAYDYILKPFRNLDEINESVNRAAALHHKWFNILKETKEVKSSTAANAP